MGDPGAVAAWQRWPRAAVAGPSPVRNGILWKLRTGAPWRDLPERYGPWRTVYARFVRWQGDGTWDRLLAHVQTKSDAVGEVIWEISIDSSVVRAHQHAAKVRKRGRRVAG